MGARYQFQSRSRNCCCQRRIEAESEIGTARKIAEFLTSVLESLRIVSYKYNTYTPTMLLTVAHMEIKLGTHM